MEILFSYPPHPFRGPDLSASPPHTHTFPISAFSQCSHMTVSVLIRTYILRPSPFPSRSCVPCPAVVTVLALTFWFCSRVNNRPLCLHCFSLRYNDHISVQNYNTLPSTARPLGDDSGCCSCLLSGAKLSAVLILLAPSGLLARPAGGIAAILRFPSIFLLCWFPCALNPMPASSLLCSFVLSEVTATSAVRPGRENLKFCFPFFFF